MTFFPFFLLSPSPISQILGFLSLWPLVTFLCNLAIMDVQLFEGPLLTEFVILRVSNVSLASFVREHCTLHRGSLLYPDPGYFQFYREVKLLE